MDIRNVWATSDTHFGHFNIIKYSNRPFRNTDEMDEALIVNWNSCVQPKHTIFHLGDLAFAEEGRIYEILQRLNGEIVFIPGNHDQQVYKSRKIRDRFKNAAALHEIARRDMQLSSGIRLKASLTYELKHDLTISGLVVMSHYAHLVWNKSHHRSVFLHGHSHGTLTYPGVMRQMDVGVDPNTYFPVNVADAVMKLDKIETPSPFDLHGDRLMAT